jgi:hypothetical protein
MTNIIIPIEILPYMSIYYTVVSDYDTPGRIHHSMTTEIHSPARGKVTQPFELMVVEVRLYLLMDTNIVIVVEYPENKYLRH